MEPVDHIANTKKGFSFKYALLSRNLTIGITTIVLFWLYFYWVQILIEGLFISYITGYKAYNFQRVDIFFKKYPHVEVYEGLLIGVFFLSIVIFYFLHKKWNYDTIKKRKYTKMIGKFLLLWMLTNSIRGVVIAYVPNENSLKSDVSLCLKILQQIEEKSETHKRQVQEGKNPLTLNQLYSNLSIWAGNNMNKLRFVLFLMIGGLSSIFSIFSCFLFGIWGYVSNKHSIANEDDSQALDSTKIQIKKENRNNKTEYWLLFTGLFLIFQLILVNSITYKLPSEKYVLIFFATTLGSLLLFNLNVQTSLKVLRNQEYLAGLFWSFILLFAVTFAEIGLYVMITFRDMDSIFGQLFKYNFLLCVISFTVGYAKRTEELFEEKIKAVIKQKDLEIEANNLEIEAKKSQIDAHFIYNGLSFISSKSLLFSKELSEQVVLFAAIVRYSLIGATSQDSNDGTNTQVYLKDELEHLKNYIDFNLLRLSNKLQIKFECDCDGSEEIIEVPPLILIGYVENAIKYGVREDVDNPIIIRVKVEQDNLVFYVQNKKNHDKGVISSKKGNEINKRRLELSYPNAHKLQIVDEPDFYTVSLTIQL